MKNITKKALTLICAAALTILPSCGAASGSVSTDGSTSMEKVIGALGESFTNENKGVNFTYNPTGSGSGIKAVLAGTCDIGLSSRALKADEELRSLTTESRSS